jgi:hypothetical protein
MAGGKRPSPLGLDGTSEDVDDGTLCRAASPQRGPVGATASYAGSAAGRGSPNAPASIRLVSPALKTTVDVSFSIAPQMTWDGFQRLAYDRLSAGLQEQANSLVKRGNITYQEMENLVSARNASVLKIRDRLSSFGRMYSELLKPGASLKTAEQLLAEKGSIEAVLESVGRTRQVVDRIGIVSRWAGPGAIVLQVSIVTFVIAEAPPQDRGRVAARQIGGSVFGIVGGSGGLWLGCASGASLVSWSVVVPIVGEEAIGGACLVGGLLGGLGIGFGSQKVGESVGEGAYNFVTELRWVK